MNNYNDVLDMMIFNKEHLFDIINKNIDNCIKKYYSIDLKQNIN
jgi:hypothetical protein